MEKLRGLYPAEAPWAGRAEAIGLGTKRVGSQAVGMGVISRGCYLHSGLQGVQGVEEGGGPQVEKTECHWNDREESQIVED